MKLVKKTAIANLHSNSDCSTYRPKSSTYTPSPLTKSLFEGLTQKLFTYGKTMSNKDGMSPFLKSMGATLFGEGKTSERYCMYIDEGEPKVTDSMVDSVIYGEVYELPWNIMENLIKNIEGAKFEKVWVDINFSTSGSISMMCYMRVYSDVTPAYIHNECTIIDDGNYKEYLERLLIGSKPIVTM